MFQQEHRRVEEDDHRARLAAALADELDRTLLAER